MTGINKRHFAPRQLRGRGLEGLGRGVSRAALERPQRSSLHRGTLRGQSRPAAPRHTQRSPSEGRLKQETVRRNPFNRISRGMDRRALSRFRPR